MSAVQNKKSMWRNDSGNVAITFGAVMVPMVMLMGGAVDVGRALHARSSMQQAADNGVLAAASSITSSVQQRTSIAQSMFDANASGGFVRDVARNVSVADSTVSINVTGNVPTHFLSVVGIDEIPVKIRAAAKSRYDVSTSSTDTGKICLLALDPDSTIGIAIQGDNDIRYPNCWAYSNSTRPTAMQEDGTSASAVGEGNCAVGGYDSGGAGTGEQFSPRPRTGCQAVADPYATVGAYSGGTYTPTFAVPAQPSACVYNNLDLKQGTFTIRPGRYCATDTKKPALNMQAKAKVKMLPGVYYFDGSINVQSGSWLQLKESDFTTDEAAHVNGTGVMMYLAGATSTATIQGGGTISLKGRGTGSSYEGFLMIAAATAAPGGTTNIQGGGTFNMEGVMYLPTQRVYVTGNGDVNGSTDYFGIIAKEIDFRGNGMFYLKKKGTSTTLPEILPDIPRTVTGDAYLTQ